MIYSISKKNKTDSVTNKDKDSIENFLFNNLFSFVQHQQIEGFDVFNEIQSFFEKIISLFNQISHSILDVNVVELIKLKKSI